MDKKVTPKKKKVTKAKVKTKAKPKRKKAKLKRLPTKRSKTLVGNLIETMDGEFFNIDKIKNKRIREILERVIDLL